LKPWVQELMWVRRNDQGVIVGYEENLPKSGEFIPTVPTLIKRDPAQYKKGEK
jgi:hypothetical protein